MKIEIGRRYMVQGVVQTIAQAVVVDAVGAPGRPDLYIGRVAGGSGTGREVYFRADQVVRAVDPVEPPARPRRQAEYL